MNKHDKDNNESVNVEIKSGRYCFSETGTAVNIALAFLTSAGLFYANIMPVLVSGLVEGLGFSQKTAGIIGSANIYGAALGAFISIFIVKRIKWKFVCLILLLLLISIDIISMFVSNAESLIAVRFVHGSVGGLIVGIGLSITARTKNASKAFGYLLLVQFGCGGLGVMLIPGLIPDYGHQIVFFVLIVFSSIALLTLPFLPAFPVRKATVELQLGIKKIKLYRSPVLLVLLAIFLFQASNMGPYAYIVGLGKNYNIDIAFISSSLGIAAWMGILGSLLVVFLASTKCGRTIPIVIAVFVTLVGTGCLLYSEYKWVYFVANCVVGITWAFSIAYLLGMVAEFDKAGQMAALAGLASKLGLASGPMIAALVLGDDDYKILITLAVVALFVCLLLAIYPALLLDRRESKVNVL
ncbi:MFS transporter [Dasania marina]|uniref:MFS transporter n=1 Tax=Dasania marina TaxID=471499 RepID=UPI00037D48F0|nr:MFS transporter [Dasania marina]